MSTLQRILLFFVLPILTSLISLGFLGSLTEVLVTSMQYTKQMSFYIAIIVEVIQFCALGFFLMRGRSTALTLSIFVFGLNVIIHILMFFPNAVYSDGTVNPMYIITNLIGIALSTYLVLRLDKVDVRTQMVT